MMTMEERIKAAERELLAVSNERDPDAYEEAVIDDEDREGLRRILTAFAPELFSDPPTAWLAPMEATKAMVAGWGSLDQAGAKGDYRKMRDAHLSRKLAP